MARVGGRQTDDGGKEGAASVGGKWVLLLQYYSDEQSLPFGAKSWKRMQ